MTGNEIVRAIKGHAGKIQVPVVFNGILSYLYVFKYELVTHFSKIGDVETGVVFQIVGDDAIIDVQY